MTTGPGCRDTSRRLLTCNGMGDHMRVAPESVRTGVDTSWRPLYRVAGVAAGCAVALYTAALIMVAVTTTPPASGGAAILEYVGAHRSSYIVRQLLWLLPSLFLMVVFLALTVAIRRQGRSFALIAGLVAASSWAVSFAWPTTGDGSLAMVVLSDRYADATTATERASYVAGAEVLSALNDVPAVIGVLQTLGLLLISLLMLRGVFTKPLAVLGVATGVIGIVSEALRPVLGGAYALYGVLLFVWLAWAGIELWRLGASRTEPTAREPLL